MKSVPLRSHMDPDQHALLTSSPEHTRTGLFKVYSTSLPIIKGITSTGYCELYHSSFSFIKHGRWRCPPAGLFVHLSSSPPSS